MKVEKIICVNIDNIVFVVKTEDEEYYLIDTQQEKIVKGDLEELTKWGYWFENRDESKSLINLLNNILNDPLISIDNRLAGTLEGYVLRNQYDYSKKEAEGMAKKMNEIYK